MRSARALVYLGGMETETNTLTLSTGHVSRCDCGDRSRLSVERGASDKDRACTDCHRSGRF